MTATSSMGKRNDGSNVTSRGGEDEDDDKDYHDRNADKSFTTASASSVCSGMMSGAADQTNHHLHNNDISETMGSGVGVLGKDSSTAAQSDETQRLRTNVSKGAFDNAFAMKGSLYEVFNVKRIAATDENVESSAEGEARNQARYDH
uniref:ATP phosphoribosyltransferase n=1 Tax=Lygus hesperus TaxID=30085 RepID=A0A0A9Y4H2_LYGHE